MGVQGRFWDASSLTWQPKYNLFRGAALRHLVSVRAVKQFEHSNPSFCFFLPSPILDKIPAPNAILRKFGKGEKSPHQN